MRFGKNRSGVIPKDDVFPGPFIEDCSVNVHASAVCSPHILEHQRRDRLDGRAIRISGKCRSDLIRTGHKRSVLLSCGILFAILYPLSRESHRKIVADLEERRKSQAA